MTGISKHHVTALFLAVVLLALLLFALRNKRQEQNMAAFLENKTRAEEAKSQAAANPMAGKSNDRLGKTSSHGVTNTQMPQSNLALAANMRNGADVYKLIMTNAGTLTLGLTGLTGNDDL